MKSAYLPLGILDNVPLTLDRGFSMENAVSIEGYIVWCYNDDEY